MSKIIYVCFNNSGEVDISKTDIQRVCKRITPDNITLPETEVFESEGILYGIVNPSVHIDVKGNSVLLGQVFGEADNWEVPGTEAPDGSYAIFRADSSTVELVTDVVASRTIWYYMDDRVFISSASQRAIIIMLQSFSFNSNVLPWIMSTGSLGPGNSWDTRIKMVPSDTVLSLNRSDWQISTLSHPIKFSSDILSEQVHHDRLKKSLVDTFQSLKLDFGRWILSLSGGYDSRSIACFFNAIGRDLSKLNSFTLGLQSSVHDARNDAFIAGQVANHFNMPNTYFSTDLVGNIESILNRFFRCGEGRIDHLSAYMDGLEIWKTLFNQKFSGIIKGDESLGWVTVFSDKQVRSSLGIGLCSDYSNLEHYKQFGFPDQELPLHLLQTKDESLDQWRDRLYQQFRIPVVLAALTDLKAGYVEVINPLLSKRIIYNTRRLPDKLRTNKELFKDIVDSIGPSIPFAKTPAIFNRTELLRSHSFIELFKKEIYSEEAKALFTEDFLQPVLKGILKGKMNNGSLSIRLKKTLLKFLPDRLLRKLVKSAPKTAVDNHLLAFRIYLVIKMKRLLEEDSALLKTSVVD